MERRENRRGGATKRRHKSQPSDSIIRRSLSPHTVVSLTLAALTNPRNPSSEPVIKYCLDKLLHFLLSKPSNLLYPTSENLFNSIIAIVLPLLSKSRCSEIVSTSALIVGATSLISYEMNVKIASDDEIVNALVLKVVSTKRRVAMAACNAILDLSSSMVGRQRLLELSGLDYLLLGFIQVLKSSRSSISLCTMDEEGVAYLGVKLSEDELFLLLFNAAVTLINSCSIGQLERIPRKLIEASLIYLKELWAEVHQQMLDGQLLNTCPIWNNCVLTANDLAEGIFRLSMSAFYLANAISWEVVVNHIFGPCEYSFQSFISDHWESSPFLRRTHAKILDEPGDMFTSSLQFLNRAGTVPLFLSSILRAMVSCVPIASDEIDILSFLKEVKHNLACPLIYQQDIRVIRTEPRLKTEEHYFQGSLETYSSQKSSSFHINDILKCVEAYEDGYTIALRGMEFRFASVAAIVDKVASLFGQPSVGANLYLTPPNSQGLACHYDDHCVFVCQLCGTKQWTISSQPLVPLPRLYHPLLHPPDSVQSRQIVLREGDVFYIPRGFPHEASTTKRSDEAIGASEFSLHLTLAVEIEPPFEWEGFAHVALHCWSQNQKFCQDLAFGFSEIMNVVSVSFLHVAIRLISGAESIFRRACLVAAKSLPSDTEDWLDKNQRAIFKQLIDKISELAGFTEALHSVQMAIQRNEDPFHWMRWLRVLKGQDKIEHCWNGIDKLLSLIHQHKDSAEAAFLHVKSNFCREVVFEDVKLSFKMLYAMYKKVRKQYMNGMLSLHDKP
ncbi:hypothetical protein Ancab_027842 [Ancistrocladus abbreviatus]